MRINIRYEERKVRMEERIESSLQFLPYRNQPVMHGKNVKSSAFLPKQSPTLRQKSRLTSARMRRGM